MTERRGANVFPVRLDTMVFLTDRKLFAKGFLSDVTL